MSHHSPDGGSQLVLYSTPLSRFRCRKCSRRRNQLIRGRPVICLFRLSVCLSVSSTLPKQIERNSNKRIKSKLSKTKVLFRHLHVFTSNFQDDEINPKSLIIFFIFHLPPLTLEFHMLQSKMIMHCDLIDVHYDHFNTATIMIFLL